MTIEVDLTAKRLNEDLAALGSLKRLSFLDSVDSHGFLRGFRRIFNVPVVAVIDTAVFLAQRRSTFEKCQIRMILLKAGFRICMKCDTVPILEFFVKMSGKWRGSLHVLTLVIVSLVTHGHRGHRLWHRESILPD